VAQDWGAYTKTPCASDPNMRVISKLALQPARCLIRFQGGGAVAFKALQRALTLAAGRQRKDQEGPAAGASRTFSLAHNRDIMTADL
jgi:hypothetical protein